VPCDSPEVGTANLPTSVCSIQTVWAKKSMTIENFNKHFSTAGIAFHLATPTPVNNPETPTATSPSLPHFSFTQIQIGDVLKELQNLDP
jgi:hypothetical protein